MSLFVRNFCRKGRRLHWQEASDVGRGWATREPLLGDTNVPHHGCGGGHEGGFVKTHQILHLKSMNFITWKLDLIKAS